MSEFPGRDAVKAFGDTRASFWKSPPRGQCFRAGCSELDAILYQAEDGNWVCAEHYRAQSKREKAYPCDKCGSEPAFRDPLHRRDEMLCAKCHNDAGYIPGDRAMVTKVAARVGVTHKLGRKEVCIAAGHGTECKGEVKQRGSKGLLCNFHHNPKKYLENKGD